MAINFLNTVAVDESVLFVDTVNDRVGIGTASPSRKLVVSGAADGIIQSNDTTGDGSHLRMLADVTAQNVINWDKDTALRFATSDEDWANYSERMRITSGGELIINGTTSAYGVSQGYPLHVKGTSSQGYVSICRGTQNSGSEGLIVGTDSSNAYLLSRDNINLVLGTNNLSHVFIKPSGNVGIGTTAPNEKLDVAGKVYIESQGVNWSETTPGLVRGALHFDPVGDGADNTGNAITFGASDYTSGENAQAGIYTRSDGAYGTKMYFATTDSYNIGSKTAMIINHDKDVYFLDDIDVAGQVRIASALLLNQENTDIDSAAAEVVAQVAHATYTAAFFDFVVKKGTNVRSGTVYACHNGDTTPLVEFTETSTNDLGDTSDVTLSVDISGANMRLLATVTSDDWSVKSLIRAI